jgi:hypothetical protein
MLRPAGDGQDCKANRGKGRQQEAPGRGWRRLRADLRGHHNRESLPPPAAPVEDLGRMTKENKWGEVRD